MRLYMSTRKTIYGWRFGEEYYGYDIRNTEDVYVDENHEIVEEQNYYEVAYKGLIVSERFPSFSYAVSYVKSEAKNEH